MKSIIRIIVSIIICGIAISLVSVHPANATGNTIYFSPNNIPAPATIGTQISYKLYADTVGSSPSNGMSGWDFVITDNDAAQAILNPVSISIKNNVLTSFGQVQEVINCVNGGIGIPLNSPGNMGCGNTPGVADGPGITHTAAVLLGIVPSPVSGLIANITYQTVAAGPTTLNFVAGGDTVSDGSGTPVTHKSLTATYGTPATPDFRISAPNGTLPAPINPGVSGSAAVNFTSLSGQTGTITIAQDIYPSTGLTFSCGTPTPAVLPPGLSSSVTCTYSSALPAVYVVTLNVTIGTPAKFHLAPMTIRIGDFKVTTSPITLTFPKGATGKGNATVTSINGFSSNVILSSRVTPATGLSVTGCPASVTVAPTAPAIAQCNFISTLSNLYTVQFNATYQSGTTRLSRYATMNVNIQDIKLTPAASSLVFGANYTATDNVAIASVRTFGGSTGSIVSVTTAANSTAISAACNPTSVTLKSGDVKSTLCMLNSQTPGNYYINITATSGLTVNMTRISITVNPDFRISVGPAVSMTPGTTGNNNITVTGYGFSGTVTFSVSASTPVGLTCSAPASVTLPPSPAKTMLSCTATGTQTYNVTVTATSGTISHSVIATFTTAPEITVTGVTVSTPSATVGNKITVNVGIKYIGGVASNFMIIIKWGGIQVATANYTAAATTTPTMNNYTVTWDTSGLSPDTRVITASVPPLPNEVNVADNSATGPSVTLAAAPGGILSGATLYAVVGGVIVAAAAAAGALVFLRRRKAKPATPAAAP